MQLSSGKLWFRALPGGQTSCDHSSKPWPYRAWKFPLPRSIPLPRGNCQATVTLYLLAAVDTLIAGVAISACPVATVTCCRVTAVKFSLSVTRRLTV